MASSPDGLDAALAAQFEVIRRQFVAGLARRRTEIETAPDDVSLHAALHRLAGAAGGYGYAELGRLARDALQAIEAREPGGPGASLALLGQELDRLIG